MLHPGPSLLMQHVHDDPIDWDALRQASLLPGGFGADRQHLWPQLLRVPELEETPEPAEESGPHADERQIQLDTDRSFVLYSVDDAKKDREELQHELHELLVSVFRKRPKLSYFQGYHDIITVFFLTLPSEMQLPCAEKLSLQRLRDSMGAGLEPVLGLLRVMQNLLRAVDPAYSELLERTSPLPFYALSNLLTLFSHDMPTLPLIQHVFDYMLCRPPVIVVYLAAAVILARKDEVYRLEQEDEDGMIHSLLSSLPNITDAEQCTNKEEPDDSPMIPLLEDPQPSVSDTSLDDESTALDTDSEAPTDEDSTVVDTDSEPDDEHIKVEGDELVLSAAVKEEQVDAHPPPAEVPPRKPTISLVSLLLHADEMLDSYPPAHPSLALASIMGPQSVVYTWSTTLSKMPSDDEAERMVEKPELTVFPPPAEPTKEKNEERPIARRRPRRRALSRRTMIATAVLALALSLAFYGTRNDLGRWRTSGYGRTGGWLQDFVVTGARLLDLHP